MHVECLMNPSKWKVISWSVYDTHRYEQQEPNTKKRMSHVVYALLLLAFLVGSSRSDQCMYPFYRRLYIAFVSVKHYRHTLLNSIIDDIYYL